MTPQQRLTRMRRSFNKGRAILTEDYVFFTMPSSPIVPSHPSPLTARQEKKRREAMQALRDSVRAKLAAGTPKAIAPTPSPRYDDIFEEGTRWLTELALRDLPEPV